MNLFLLSIIVFFYILAPRIDLTGYVIHTGILAVIFLGLISLKNHPKLLVSKSILGIYLFFSILAIYNTSISEIYGNNPEYFNTICFNSSVSITFGWMVASTLTNKRQNIVIIDYIILICIAAITLNSIIVITEYYIPSIKNQIESLLLNIEGANIDYLTHPFRIRGLSSGGGSSLSVVNALTILLIIFSMRNRQISGFHAIFMAAIIAYSNIFIGRTGLIFGFIFFIFLLLVFFKENLSKHHYYKIVILTLIIFAFLFITPDFNLDDSLALWAFELFYNIQSNSFKTESSDDLFSMLNLPSNFWHLLFGIGFFEGDNLLYQRSDSGYLKTIYSIGLVFAILLYTKILYIFFKMTCVSSKYFWTLISISAFLLMAEIKEPVLYQNYSARIIFMLSGASLFILSKKSRSIKQRIAQ